MFKNGLSEPIDGRVLGLFRLMFGLFMTYEAWVYYRMQLIEKGLLAPKVLFKFDGLGWLTVLPKPVMLAILALMGLSALFIAMGVLFRWACWIFVFSLSFIFFQEKSYYNNHIYLFILLGVLLSFTHADHFLSLRNKNNRYDSVPRWQQFVLQAQFIRIRRLRADDVVFARLHVEEDIERRPLVSARVGCIRHRILPQVKLGPDSAGDGLFRG